MKSTACGVVAEAGEEMSSETSPLETAVEALQQPKAVRYWTDYSKAGVVLKQLVVCIPDMLMRALYLTRVIL